MPGPYAPRPAQSNPLRGWSRGNRLPPSLPRDRQTLQLVGGLRAQCLCLTCLFSLELSVLLWLSHRGIKTKPVWVGRWPPAGQPPALSGPWRSRPLCLQPSCPHLLGTLTCRPFSHFGHPAPNRSPAHWHTVYLADWPQPSLTPSPTKNVNSTGAGFLLSWRLEQCLV